MERDITSELSDASGLDIQAITTNTTTVGNIIDSLDFESLNFSFLSGTITDGTYTVIVEDGDAANLSDAAAVAAEFIILASGQTVLPVFLAADDNVTKRFGYVGKKRYVRSSVVSAGTTTGGTLSAIAVKGHPRSAPTA